MASEAEEWMRLDEAIKQGQDSEAMLANRSAHFVNRLMPENHFNRVAHTLLYTAVFGGHSEIVALLLWHGADPLQTAVIYRCDNGSTNAVDVCVVHLHAQPTHGVFLLRLLNGEDIDAPLIHPTLTRDKGCTVNALEWACKHRMVHCVRWLLYRRNADPSAVHGGFDALMRRLDTGAQIRAMLIDWSDRQLAVAMAAHSRLGHTSALGALGPDLIRLVLS
jgi:hypothetical protein